MTATTPGIDDKVKRVMAWTQLFRQCANQVTQRAHDQFMADAIDLATYSKVSQQMIGILQQCIAMTDAAASTLANVALSQVAPIQDATAKLADAAKKIDAVENAVTIAAELVAAVAAVGAAVAAPTLAGVAGAAAALSTVATGILVD